MKSCIFPELYRSSHCRGTESISELRLVKYSKKILLITSDIFLSQFLKQYNLKKICFKNWLERHYLRIFISQCIHEFMSLLLRVLTILFRVFNSHLKCLSRFFISYIPGTSKCLKRETSFNREYPFSKSRPITGMEYKLCCVAGRARTLWHIRNCNGL